MEIKVLKNVMIKNDAVGNDNRNRFKQNKVYVLNITSSPGAGKTTLIQLLMQQLEPATGFVRHHQNNQVAFFDQRLFRIF